MSERDTDMNSSHLDAPLNEANSINSTDRSPKLSQTHKGGRPIPTRDTTYYCDSVVLQVEDSLFKIPRSVLQDSEVFAAMWSMPQAHASDGIIDGTDDEHPIYLDGHSARDFRRLLRVIHPIPAITRELYTWDEWESVLKLATLWGFADARDKAIKALILPNVGLPPIDQLIMSKTQDIPQWLLPALETLAKREETLSLEEARRLTEVAGWEFSFQVGRVRDAWVPVPMRHCDFEWSCSAAGCRSRNAGAQRGFKCVHRDTLFIESTSTKFLQWPCSVCTQYLCASCGNSETKLVTTSVPQMAPRKVFNFTSAIKKEFNIPS